MISSLAVGIQLNWHRPTVMKLLSPGTRTSRSKHEDDYFHQLQQSWVVKCHLYSEGVRILGLPILPFFLLLL